MKPGPGKCAREKEKNAIHLWVLVVAMASACRDVFRAGVICSGIERPSVTRRAALWLEFLLIRPGVSVRGSGLE